MRVMFYKLLIGPQSDLCYTSHNIIHKIWHCWLCWGRVVDLLGQRAPNLPIHCRLQLTGYAGHKLQFDMSRYIDIKKQVR